jgi:hypothetical protein
MHSLTVIIFLLFAVLALFAHTAKAWDFYVGGQGGSIGCYDSIDYNNENMCGSTVPVSLRCETKGPINQLRLYFYDNRNSKMRLLHNSDIDLVKKEVCTMQKGKSTYRYFQLNRMVSEMALKVFAYAQDGQARVACISYKNGKRSGKEYIC